MFPLFQVILCFYESKYGKCLTLLEEMKDNLLLDVYLAGHVHNLYSLIRNRSLIQYFRSVMVLGEEGIDNIKVSLTITFFRNVVSSEWQNHHFRHK